MIVIFPDSGFKSLGAAVIMRAVQDASESVTPASVPAKVRDVVAAMAFLCDDNPVLRFWCAVADFDPIAVRREADARFGVQRAVLQAALDHGCGRVWADRRAVGFPRRAGRPTWGPVGAHTTQVSAQE